MILIRTSNSELLFFDTSINEKKIWIFDAYYRFPKSAAADEE